jgi:hypothetical protein
LGGRSRQQKKDRHYACQAFHLELPLSKVEPERELHNPQVARRRILAEARVNLSALRIETRGRINRAELCMVEGIVVLGAEL